MKKHKLLERAMRDYPAGTVANLGDTTVDITSSGVFHIEKIGDSVFVVDRNGNAFYSRSGKSEPVWAELSDILKPVRMYNPNEIKKASDFIMDTIDGKPIFVGDPFFIARLFPSKGWQLDEHDAPEETGGDVHCFVASFLTMDDPCVADPKNNVAFWSKTEARAFVLEQNELILKTAVSVKEDVINTPPPSPPQSIIEIDDYFEAVVDINEVTFRPRDGQGWSTTAMTLSTAKVYEINAEAMKLGELPF